MKHAGTQKSRKTGSLPARRAREGKRRPVQENLVAEIVDEITSKQSRATQQQEAQLSAAETCTLCLEPPVAGSAYHLVFKCVTGENPPSDP